MSKSEPKPIFSKVSANNQTVLPRDRERLGVWPGDRLRYVFDGGGVRLEKAFSREEEDPFVSFNEWSTDADEAAYADL